MDPITNPNVANYPINVPQNNQLQEYPDYSNIPMVYEPEVEQKKSASSNMLGMTLLGVIGEAGILYGISKNKKVSGLNQQISQLSAEKDAALKMKDEAVKLQNETKQALEKERTLSAWQRFKRLFNPNSGLTKEEKDARLAAKKAKKETVKSEKSETKPENNPESKEPENK